MAVIHKMLPGLQISLERAKRQWWFIGQSCVALRWCKHEPQQRHNTKHRKSQQHHNPAKSPQHIRPPPSSSPPPPPPSGEKKSVGKTRKTPATRQIINRMMATTAAELKSPSWKASAYPNSLSDHNRLPPLYTIKQN